MTSAGAPRLSMLVPVYNVEAFVGDCLHSLLAQAVDGLEVIVVNDGSTDGSLEVVQAICDADHRVRVTDKVNSGYGDSLNRALDAARGEFVGILESDDELVEGSLGALLDEAARLEADVVKGDYILWWPTDKTRTRRANEVTAELCGSLVDTTADLRIYSRRSTIWSAIYRRSFLEEHRIRFQPTPGASFQDTSFNFKAFACCRRAAFIDMPIIRYRQDNAGSSIHAKDKAYAVCGEFDEIDAWLKETRGDKARGLLEESLVQRFNAYLWNLDRLDDVDGKAFLEFVGSQYAEFEASGRFDPSSWDGWRLGNLRALQKDPGRYLRIRRKHRSQTTAGKAKFALALGGPSLLAKAALESKGRR